MGILNPNSNSSFQLQLRDSTRGSGTAVNLEVRVLKGRFGLSVCLRSMRFFLLIMIELTKLATRYYTLWLLATNVAKINEIN